ncbi:protein-disulfide reductase DsbD [Pseudomonas abieticivorans]|uniref:protein-disulfide reductase DsbD n=1 Tax=Pseudomonas abieticivorans TaxID=2931382 RepID=UPI0020BFF837|nr:protein-disulfide reductase DsbD [Pseudomonas sp. PIA16]
MKLFALWAMLLFSTLAQAAFPLAVEPRFLPADRAFSLSHETLASGEQRLHWDIAPGYYLYKNRLLFGELPADQHPALPEGIAHHDEFFGEQPVYRDSLELTLPATARGQVKLSWQGCADAGLCYPPQTQVIDLGGAAVAPQASDQALASGLQGRTLGLSLLVFFGLGLLLAFTPCSLPMLPILAGVVVGSGASTRRSVLLASSYVVSMALVYAGMGVVAALLGANLQATLQQPLVLGAFAALFVLLALPMFGLFELQLPSALRDRLQQAGSRQRGGSLLGAGVLGLFSGVLVGPCMTAPLAGALLYIAQSGDALKGALVLFAMGLGMGLPLVALVTVGQRLLPKPGAWMNLVKGVFGLLFLGTALLVVRPVLDPATWLLLAALLTLGAATASAIKVSHRLVGTTAATMLGLWGVLMLVGAAGGSDDPLQPLKVYTGQAAATSTNNPPVAQVDQPQALQAELDAAQAAGQWVLLDYTADWCVNCKVMEKNIFQHPQTQAALAQVRRLKVDVTHDTPASRALLDRYQVVGPPTLIWLGPNGEERRAQRITGLVDRATFLANWNTTKDQG